jgi:hypothetical protein
MFTAGRTEAEASERIRTGASWNEFCDTLKAAGAVILREGAPDDAFTRAEGFRYLSRLVRAGLEAFLEHADPRAPSLRRTVHETVKMGADNPDNLYQNAAVSGQYEYRITGRRGTVRYLSFSTQSGGYGEGLGAAGDRLPRGRRRRHRPRRALRDPGELRAEGRELAADET